MEYSVTALSLGNEVQGSIELAFVGEEEFVGNLPPVVERADKYPDASAFPRAVADEFVNKTWTGVDIRSGSPVLYILSAADGKVVPLIALASALVIGAVNDVEDINAGIEYENGLSVALYFVVGAPAV